MARAKKTETKASSADHYEPLGNRVIVERIEAEEVSQGGIIIAEAAREKPIRGIVVAVGEGAIRPDGTVTPMNLRVGDEVVYGRYSGVDVELNHKDYLVLRAEEIMARLVRA